MESSSHKGVFENVLENGRLQGDSGTDDARAPIEIQISNEPQQPMMYGDTAPNLIHQLPPSLVHLDPTTPSVVHNSYPLMAGRQRRQKNRPWTQDEDNSLREAIVQFGLANWGAIAERVGNGRTRSQCSQRWKRVLDPGISRDNWTAAEEERLLELTAKHGPKAWRKISFEMGNRSDVQCRFKYKFLMKKGDPRIIPVTMQPAGGPLVQRIDSFT